MGALPFPKHGHTYMNFPNRKYNPFGPSPATRSGAPFPHGILIAVTAAIFIFAGCASSSGVRSTAEGERDAQVGRGESYSFDDTKKVTEMEIDTYLRSAYAKIEPNSLSAEERELLRDEQFLESDLTEFARELSNFVSKKLPYVDLKRPTTRDLAFVIRYGDVVYCYREYLEIDMKNLSQNEIDSIRAFRRENPSGKIDPRDFSGWETAALQSLRMFANFDNMSDRDIVLFHRVGIRLPKSRDPAHAVWGQ